MTEPTKAELYLEDLQFGEKLDGYGLDNGRVRIVATACGLTDEEIRDEQLRIGMKLDELRRTTPGETAVYKSLGESDDQS